MWLVMTIALASLLLTASRGQLENSTSFSSNATTSNSNTSMMTTTITTTTKATTTTTQITTLVPPLAQPLWNVLCTKYQHPPNTSTKYQVQLYDYLLKECTPYVASVYVDPEFGINYYDIPVFEPEYTYYFSTSYIVGNHFNVSRDVIIASCNAYLKYVPIEAVFFDAVEPFVRAGAPLSKGLNEWSTFIELCWSPVDITVGILGWIILRRVLKGHDMPSRALFRAEVILQVLWAQTYLILYSYNLAMGFIFFAPFCYISAYTAVNIPVLVNIFNDIFLVFWLYGAMVKCAIAFERMLCISQPLVYMKYVNRRNINITFALVSCVYFAIIIILYGVTFGIIFQGQAAYSLPSQSTVKAGKALNYLEVLTFFFASGIAVVGALHVCFSSVLTWKMFTKKVIKTGSQAQQEKLRRDRDLSIFILSTAFINIITYFIMVLFIFKICGDHPYGFNACAIPSLSQFVGTFNRTVAAIVIGLNVPVCFILQCILCRPFRMAAIDLLLKWPCCGFLRVYGQRRVIAAGSTTGGGETTKGTTFASRGARSMGGKSLSVKPTGSIFVQRGADDRVENVALVEM